MCIMAGNWLQNLISSAGKAINAPVVSNWDTDAAREDVAANNGKRGVDSVAFAAVNSGKESYRANGKIYDYSGKQIGTYPTSPQAPGPGAPTPIYQGDVNTGGNNSSYSSGVSGGSGVKVGDASTINQYQTAISDLERSLGLLPGQLEAGLNQINDGFNKGVSRLNEQHSAALSKFATQRGDTRADFDGSLGDIDSQSRGNFQAIQSLLGRNGAGSSSAASVITPYAVANEASKTRGKVADTYGRNLRDLTVAEDATKLSYDNNKKDLEDTKRTSEYGLKQGIESNRAKLYGSIGEAQGNLALAKGANWQAAKDAMSNSVNAKNGIESAMSTLLNQYRNPYVVKDVAVKEAKLDNYAVDANGVKIDGTNGTGDTDTAALTQAQIKAEEDRKKKLLTA